MNKKDLLSLEDVVQSYIKQIKKNIVENIELNEKFAVLAKDIKKNISNDVVDDDVIEMLSQQLITKPIFSALFKSSKSQKNNFTSKFDDFLLALQSVAFNRHENKLQKFHDQIEKKISVITDDSDKQKAILELYDDFFKKAFKKMTERLGIVYTPIEIVDFIIHSIEHVLNTQFDQSLGSKGVHILDPFTGTGTFITRLLQSGIIKSEDLQHKYDSEIYANEIVMLAYYIAKINVENVYRSISDINQEFKSIKLLDTFKQEPNQDKKQIRVIMGNPPYSVGQKKENDNNKNLKYPILDKRLAETYIAQSKATLKNSLYDSYIRSIRWASDQIGDAGVIGFVTNAGFVDSNSGAGMRKCLADEFSNIWIFHLRGNCRTSGERQKKERGNVFGNGSRAPIAISVLVKNPSADEHGKIYYHDIGDYLTREQKLEKIADFVSLKGITDKNAWQEITPDKHGDWINQRDDSFNHYFPIASKEKNFSNKIFDIFSNGIMTCRDAWCWNLSQKILYNQMNKLISNYNDEVIKLEAKYPNKTKKELESLINSEINNDLTEINWTSSLKENLIKKQKFFFNETGMRVGIYRPFTKQHIYFNRNFNERVYQIPKIFPNKYTDNLIITVTGSSAKNFSCLTIDCLPDRGSLSNALFFPLYIYDEDGSNRRDAITDAALVHFQAAYPSLTISKEDIFYYIYGLLHSEDYRTKYADNLSKELPRIPRVKKESDFRAFSQAGRKLANLHINYETVDCYQVTLDSKATDDKHYHVKKMKHPKKKIDGKSVDDKSSIIYNHRVIINDIPIDAYRYVVNGKSAIGWVMDRQSVKTDKDSGIVNDANLWAIDTMDNPKYPLELLLRVITVSIETMKIVDDLPKIDFNCVS